MSISEKIKSAGRARKASSAAPSDHDASGSSVVSGIMASPDPPAPKAEKPKKKGTAAPIKKRGLKPKTEGTPNFHSSLGAERLFGNLHSFNWLILDASRKWR